MARSREQIFRIIESHKDEIKKFGVRRLALFGSAARDKLSDDSDLDFVVEFAKKSFDNYMDLKFFLEDLFHARLILSSPKP